MVLNMQHCRQPKIAFFPLSEPTALKPFSILSRRIFLLQIAGMQPWSSPEFREDLIACLRSRQEEGKGFPPCNLVGALWANTLLHWYSESPGVIQEPRFIICSETSCRHGSSDKDLFVRWSVHLYPDATFSSKSVFAEHDLKPKQKTTTLSALRLLYTL